MKSVFFKITVGVAMASFLAACSPMSENSLLTDDISDPTSHNMNTDPNSTELFLQADKTNLGSTSNGSAVEMSGNCFASTYPTHKITAAVGNTAKYIFDITSSANTSTSTSGTCRNGRFNIAIKAANLTVGSNTITLTIRGYDSSGNENTSGNGSTQFSVTRAN
ncbi:MAG: hypothetical protein J7501_00145 [Bdellovibrio sp.]|nr:hypothetical protein [Bdellovibrio sp.]